jgi:hypothetical protein
VKKWWYYIYNPELAHIIGTTSKEHNIEGNISTIDDYILDGCSSSENWDSMVRKFKRK